MFESLAHITSPGLSGLALVGVAITHLHPGSGRFPGLVDLPVVKDGLGYPLVPASSVKGAMKTKCARTLNAKILDGKIDCSDKGIGDECGGGAFCCCLFGGEVGEGGAGLVSVLDLVPLAFPVASADKGFVYVAPKSLLARASAIFGTIGYKEAFKLFTNLASQVLLKEPSAAIGIDGKVYLFTTPINVRRVNLSDEDRKTLEEFVNTLRDLHPLAAEITNRLIILDDFLASKVVDRGLLRVTRVRLNRKTKTVKTGGLWTEEYIPQATIFISALIATGYLNTYCETAGCCKEGPGKCLKEVRKKLELDGGLPIFVGGKETIGKGLIVFKPL